MVRGAAAAAAERERGKHLSVNDVLLALGQATSQPPLFLWGKTMLTDLNH